ncbi:phosphatidylinositol transfer protein csr1 [Massospora cicadina]|nr:phosphatidylinositol transfer protein csr1 [Massospora cicadina]
MRPGVWKIVSAMLDPVVAEKVKFVSVKELPEYIDPSYLPESLGGTMKQEFIYVPPQPNENLKLDDVEGQRVAQKRFDEAIIDFESETRNWATSTSPSPKRDEAAARLKAAYVELDPFIRARTIYHRLGVIGGIEDVDWSRLKA